MMAMLACCGEFRDTELGKALARLVPPETRRVIIDVDFNGVVKVYTESFATGEILNLAWGEVIANVADDQSALISRVAQEAARQVLREPLMPATTGA